MTQFPTLEQAFARVRKEATRQDIMKKGDEGESHIPAAMISRGQRNFEVNYTPNRNSGATDKATLKCTHCGQTRHTKEQCFQLVGYPEWFKDRRKGKNNWHGKGRAAIAHGNSAGANFCENGNRAVARPQQGSGFGETGNRTQGESTNSLEHSSYQGRELHAAGHQNQENFGPWY
ncbi:uncharacterized protein LOC144567504 [Carex rostrata]